MGRGEGPAANLRSAIRPVAVIGGTRLAVSIEEVRHWIVVVSNIPGDSVQVRRYHPEVFMVVFSYCDDLLRVLYDRPPPGMPFSLIFKRWRQHARTSKKNLYYWVTAWLRGIPANAWNVTTAQKVHSSARSGLQPTSETIGKTDLRRYFVFTWCIHPDLIPREKIIFVPEPKVVTKRGPPMFMDPDEVIYPNHPTLRYKIEVDVIEDADWHVPSDSSSDSDDGNGGGS
jgi:hypothetical protein